LLPVLVKSIRHQAGYNRYGGQYKHRNGQGYCNRPAPHSAPDFRAGVDGSITPTVGLTTAVALTVGVLHGNESVNGGIGLLLLRRDFFVFGFVDEWLLPDGRRTVFLGTTLTTADPCLWTTTKGGTGFGLAAVLVS